MACLYMYKDDPDAVAVYIDTGNSFPHVRQYVIDMCKKFGVELFIRGPERPVLDWQNDNGLPSDIVPWDATPMMRGMAKKNFTNKIVPYSACCTVNIWQPLMAAIAEIGAGEVIRGSKAADDKVGVPDGYTDDNGVRYTSPLWDWTDDDVFAYIEKAGIELPEQYASGTDSLDCWCCTAYMGPHGAARMAYMEKAYPELYRQAKPRVDRVKSTVKEAVNYFYGEGVMP